MLTSEQIDSRMAELGKYLFEDSLAQRPPGNHEKILVWERMRSVANQAKAAGGPPVAGLSPSEIDELSEDLPGKKGVCSLQLGSLGGMSVHLAECPCIYSIGIKFEGILYLGRGGIKIPDENEDAMGRLIYKMYAEQAKKAREE